MAWPSLVGLGWISHKQIAAIATKFTVALALTFAALLPLAERMVETGAVWYDKSLKFRCLFLINMTHIDIVSEKYPEGH